MTQHDVIARTDADQQVDAATDTSAYVDFLTSEFPEWDFAIDDTETWSGDAHTLWIATREGHHPQSALTAGKLHRRLSDYHEREAARRPQDN